MNKKSDSVAYTFGAIFCFATCIPFCFSLGEVFLIFDSKETTGVFEGRGFFRGTERFSFEVDGLVYHGTSGPFLMEKEIGESVTVVYSSRLPFISKIKESTDAIWSSLLAISMLLIIGFRLLHLRNKERD
jgi:hypothetical protein